MEDLSLPLTTLSTRDLIYKVWSRMAHSNEITPLQMDQWLQLSLKKKDVALVHFLMALESEIEIEFYDDDIDGIETISDFYSYVEQLKNETYKN